MKKINNKIIAPIVVIGLFCACSSDENVYYSDAVIESEINASAVENSRLNSDIDYEVIPVGENNYVYLPKMASTKAVTRSAETAKNYSATITSNISTEEFGTLKVTITWNNKEAFYRLSDSYMYTHQAFRYTINGSSITIDGLSLRIYGSDGRHVGNFDYTGTLSGN